MPLGLKTKSSAKGTLSYEDYLTILMILKDESKKVYRSMDIIEKKSVDCSIENQVQIVLNMLDEAIEEYKRGEFVSEEEMFKELESIR